MGHDLVGVYGNGPLRRCGSMYCLGVESFMAEPDLGSAAYSCDRQHGDHTIYLRPLEFQTIVGRIVEDSIRSPCM